MAARISRNGARTLMSIIRSQSSSLVFSTEPEPMMPAALTRTEMPPSSFAAAATIVSGADVSVTSARQTAARPPALLTSAATSRSASSSRLTTSTAAPALPNVTAAARPMPLDAPVTTTC